MLQSKWSLLYRGSEHGFSTAAFWQHCEGKANTLTVVKVNCCRFCRRSFILQSLLRLLILLPLLHCYEFACRWWGVVTCSPCCAAERSCGTVAAA